MANFLQLGAYENLIYGPNVVKSAVAFPSNSNTNLFTVSTGNVLVTSLVGVMQTVTTSSVAVSVGFITSSATANSYIASGSTIATSAPVGTVLTPQPSSGTAGALVVGAAGTSTAYATVPFVLTPGTVMVHTTAATGGAASWYLNYVPLDAGANVS